MERVADKRFVTALTRWVRWWTFAGRLSSGLELEIGRVIAGSEFMVNVHDVRVTSRER